MVNEKWILKNKKIDLEYFKEKYNMSSSIFKILANREINNEENINNYFNSSLENLINPNNLKDMGKSIDILKEKITQKKRIRIIGDYDVDGVISTYILYTGLKRVGANVDYEIPDRIKDGYGINKNIIKSSYDDGVDTLLTCDNGISAINEIDYAKELGLTVIITDHHDVSFIENNGEKLFIKPNADAIINQKQDDCKYEFKSICGAGLSYKLIECLYENFYIDKKEAYELIEFVAIATVCDVVDLTYENRIFVKNGLEMINNTENIGLKELIKANDLEDKEITAHHLGFTIGPCINASGRLDSAKKGLELLLCKDLEKAKVLANEIVNLNKERKEMTILGVEKSIEIIEKYNLKNDNILVVYIPDMHESLAGIVAGRVKEKYNKPTIIITRSEDGAKGSCRSIEEYNIFEGLLECKCILERFGGHPMAAGLSLKEENIDKLRQMINENSKLTDEDLIKKVFIDVSIPLDSIDIKLINELKILEPFGKANSKPVFGIKDANILKGTIRGKNNNVLNLRLKSNNKFIDAILFNDKIKEFEEKFINKYGEEGLNTLYSKNSNNFYMDFTFYPSINEWNGNKYIQIMIDSIR